MLTNGKVASAYSASVTATGGSATLHVGAGRRRAAGWRRYGEQLRWEVIGTPKTAGTYSFTVQATDAAGATALGTFTITIAPAPLVLTSVSSFPEGYAGSSYPLQILERLGRLPTVHVLHFQWLAADRFGLRFPSDQRHLHGARHLWIHGYGDRLRGRYGLSFHVDYDQSEVGEPDSFRQHHSFLADRRFERCACARERDCAVNRCHPDSELFRRRAAVGLVARCHGGKRHYAGQRGHRAGCVGTFARRVGYALSGLDQCHLHCPEPLCGNQADHRRVTERYRTGAADYSTSSVVSFSALTSKTAAQSQPLGIWNTGGGTLDIGSVTPADSWLTVTGVPSTLPGEHSVLMTVTANSAGLAANFYQSSLTVVSSAGTIVVPVTLNVARSVTMTLGPSGATIQSVAGNPPGNLTGSFNVNVTGGGSINWSASVLPGSSWLSMSTPSGTATATTPGTVDFEIDPTIAAGLSAQAYAGSIQIASSTVVDSPLVFQLFLNVNPVGTPPSPQPGSGGFVLTYNSAGETPDAVHAAGSTATLLPSVTVPIYASSKTPVAYQASAATTDGGTWLSVSPSTGFASASAPGQSVISANAAGLAPGVYRGGVTYAFSSNGVSTVNITLLVGTQESSVTTTSASSLPVPAAVSTAAAGCTPTQLADTQVGRVSKFAPPAAWPRCSLLPCRTTASTR